MIDDRSPKTLMGRICFGASALPAAMAAVVHHTANQVFGESGDPADTFAAIAQGAIDFGDKHGNKMVISLAKGVARGIGIDIGEHLF